MSRAYYNEFDPFAAQWLRNLIDAGHIAPGDVDERSIVDVTPGDLDGYTQLHWFAGLGGWSLALRMAGWDDSRPVWTGSCPCQPFSNANKGASGERDPRHLWPVFASLIRECRPTVVFGEQIEGAAGRAWFASVFLDLEDMGYAAASAGLCACGVGAPHIRQRLYWVGHSNRHGVRIPPSETLGPQDSCWHHTNGHGAFDPGPHGWDELDDITLADGSRRPVPGTLPDVRPLAPRLPGRVGRLRAYGNAIVPQVAAAFIRATMEALS